ncbi:surface-adhesin E family protein [Paraburkholderia dilworthii]|uniref:surface-adhesin E family protein n=1 Tax=Paraburkholderia dilworthii TaxID=948106 RepID=UPI0038BDD7A6
MLEDFSKPQPNATKGKPAFQSLVNSVVINCATRQISQPKVLAYTGKMGGGKLIEGKGYPHTFEPFAEGSLESDIAAKICIG